MPLRTLIVDDHDFFRSTLRRFLNTLDEIEVAGEASDGAAAIAAADSLRPEIVIMDINMPNVSGYQACQSIKQHDAETSVLLYTGSVTETLTPRDDCAADGLLGKAELFDELPKWLDAYFDNC